MADDTCVKVDGDVYIKTDQSCMLSDSNLTVYGSTGNETLMLLSSVTGITVTSNVETVACELQSSQVKFARSGNTLSVHNSGNVLIYLLSSFNQTMIFDDGIFNIAFANNEVSVAGKVIEKDSSPKYLVDCGDVTPESGGGKIYMHPNQIFALTFSDVEVFGNTGTEHLYVMSGISGVHIDNAVDIVELGGSIKLYKFSQAAGMLSIFELDDTFIAGISTIDRVTIFSSVTYPVSNSGGVTYLGSAPFINDGVIRTYDEMLGVVPTESPTYPPMTPPEVEFPVDARYADQLEFTDNNYVIGSPDAWGLSQGNIPSWLEEYINCVVNNNINTSLITINEDLDDNENSITDVSIVVTRIENDNLAFASLQMTTNAELNGNTAGNSLLLQSTVTNEYAESMIKLNGDATFDRSVASFETTLTAYADADSAMASSVTTLDAAITDPTTGLKATAGAVQSLTTTVEILPGRITANAESITTLSTELTGKDGTVLTNARAIEAMAASSKVFWVLTGLDCSQTVGDCYDFEGTLITDCDSENPQPCYKEVANSTANYLRELTAMVTGQCFDEQGLPVDCVDGLCPDGEPCPDNLVAELKTMDDVMAGYFDVIPTDEWPPAEEDLQVGMIAWLPLPGSSGVTLF
ncbi:MAG: hypothetical protein DRP93_02905, partial [Candidatus Neomarinimicrobiota bacterium]